MSPEFHKDVIDRLVRDKGRVRLAGLTIVATSPRRPPDWRWRLLEIDPLVWRELPDKSLRAAGPWFLVGCPQQFKPHFGIARWIAQAPELQDLRAELEARVLARQNSAAIARVVRLPVAAIQSFQTLWFDVRSRLQDRDFIHTAVLQTDRRTQGLMSPCRWLWHVASYLEGVDRLEQLLAAYRALSPAQQQSGVQEYLAPGAQTDRELRDWIRRLLTEFAKPSSHLHQPADDSPVTPPLGIGLDSRVAGVGR